MSDPSKKLMGKKVTLISPFGLLIIHGVVRGYDPATKKWWVINLNMPVNSSTTGWFTEEELIVQ